MDIYLSQESSLGTTEALRVRSAFGVGWGDHFRKNILQHVPEIGMVSAFFSQCSRFYFQYLVLFV